MSDSRGKILLTLKVYERELRFISHREMDEKTSMRVLARIIHCLGLKIAAASGGMIKERTEKL